MLGNTLKPRYGKSKPNSQLSFLPAPATVGNSFKRQFQKKNWIALIIAVIVSFYVIILPTFSFVSNTFFYTRTAKAYPSGYPATSKQIIETTSRYIYPPIEHAPYLKELGIRNLCAESKIRDLNFPEIEKSIVQSLNKFDNPDWKVQKAKEDEENKNSDLAFAKNTFKNQDKKVFRPKKGSKYPEVVIVTAIDFEKYSVDALTKIVQNRVDYAHKQNFGIYVRWYQEFASQMNQVSFMKNRDRAAWVRVYCIRAAMFAFPEAKWFWYLDEDSLIMNHNIDIKDYILNPDSLSPIMLKEQSIIPPQGSIKTYKNSKAENMRIVLIQSETKVETNTFMVKNDNIGRSIIDQWGDPLYLNYLNFPFGPDSALTHILQWHPFILSKTCIIPSRTIAAQHTDVELPQSNGKGGDHIHYYEGDFVVQWSDCRGKTCEENVHHYFETKGK